MKYYPILDFNYALYMYYNLSCLSDKKFGWSKTSSNLLNYATLTKLKILTLYTIYNRCIDVGLMVLENGILTLFMDMGLKWQQILTQCKSGWEGIVLGIQNLYG